MNMAIHEGQVTRALTSAGYKNIIATKKDVVDVLNQYKCLMFKLEKFVFNDGTERELFNINGTIPVQYKNNTYHIPICIWLMDTHPHNAPLTFVKPTADMRIKVSMYVDHNGRIYLPYLHDWHSPSSDLLGLIQVMIVTFGESPPVYSKPKESNTPYPAQPSMPQPGMGVNPWDLPYPSGGGNNFPIPTYPGPSSFGQGRNYPPYMPSVAPATGVGGYPPYMNQGPGYPPTPGSGYNNFYNPNSPSNSGTITEEHIKASLISAVEDKLKRRIQERVNQCHAEIQTLNRTKQELVEGRQKINDILSKLEREENELKANIAILKEKEESLEKSLEGLEKVEGIDVDEAVTTTAPLYRQLLNAYSEEAAIEDAMYYIGEALRNGVIDLEIFLKHIRQLSRKQFMLRALMQKCRQKAGLAG